MFNEKIPARRLTAWLLVAAAPIAGIYGGLWPGVGLLALLCAMLSAAVQRLCPEQPRYPAVISLAQCLWIGILLGSLAGRTANCWEDASGFPVIPLILLALAGFAAKSGGERASRVGATLLWLTAILYAVALLAGAKSLRLEFMEPKIQIPDPSLVPLLLLPCAATLLPRSGKRYYIYNSAGVALLALLFSFWLNAALSPKVAAQAADPFYEYSKSISIFGTVERLESLVACAITAAWVALFSLLLSGAGYQAESVRKGGGVFGVWGAVAIAAAWMLSGWQISGEVLAVVSLVMWVLLPLLCGIKIFSKNQK